MTTEIVKYDKDVALVKALDEKYKSITIRPDNKDDYAIVMTGLKEYRDLRIEVTDWHKTGKAAALKRCKEYDAEKKKWLELLLGENTLRTTKNAEDDRLAGIENQRIEDIKAMIGDIKRMEYNTSDLTQPELQSLKKTVEALEFNEDDYMEFLADAQAAAYNALIGINNTIENRIRIDKAEVARVAENERLEKIRAEQEEAQAKIAEAQKKVDDANREIKEKQDKKEKREEAINYWKDWFKENVKGTSLGTPTIDHIDKSIITIQDHIDNEGYDQTNPPLLALLNEQLKESTEILDFRKEQAILKEAQDKLESDKKAEEDRKFMEAFEKQTREEEREQVKKNFERAAEETERKRVADELERKRLESLTPDKDKLIVLADILDGLVPPKFTDEVCEAICNDAMKGIQRISTDIRKQVEGL